MSNAYSVGWRTPDALKDEPFHPCISYLTAAYGLDALSHLFLSLSHLNVAAHYLAA